jgi:cell division protein FtsQ
MFVFILAFLLGVKLSVRPFTFNNIVVSGNNHLEEEDIKNAVYMREGENLFKLSFDELESRIKRIRWIEKMSIRKQFPHTVMINIEEAVPKALLRFDRRLFLLASNGKVLEEMGEQSTSFLPVVVGIDPEKDTGGILEALKLIDALDEKNVLSGKESINIMSKPFGLLVNMDGESVKIGHGNYREKLERWKELESEIRKKNIAVDYVDLRFKDKVIVKPLKRDQRG